MDSKSEEMCRPEFERWSREQGWDVDCSADARQRWLVWQAAWNHKPTSPESINAERPTGLLSSPDVHAAFEMALAHMPDDGHRDYVDKVYKDIVEPFLSAQTATNQLPPTPTEPTRPAVSGVESRKAICRLWNENFRLEDENQRLVARTERLEELLADCANDLESEVEARYQYTKDHPAMASKYNRDMEPVKSARQALANDKGKE